MEREVVLHDVMPSGVSLKVTYWGPKCVLWPRLESEYNSLAPGEPAAAHSGRSYFIQVISRHFESPKKAREWFVDLDKEVKALVASQEHLHEQFKGLEGRQVI